MSERTKRVHYFSEKKLATGMASGIHISPCNGIGECMNDVIGIPQKDPMNGFEKNAGTDRWKETEKTQNTQRTVTTNIHK